MTKYDVSVIRPAVKEEDIKFRGEGFSKERLKKIKAALLTFHNLETMATSVYKYQMTKEKSELNRLLLAAMLNESTHIQDFEVKLHEYGFKPSIFRYFFCLVGFVLGTFTRLLGPKAILRLGVFVETKAVAHYAELLEHVEWDDETRAVIEKDQADEDLHISRWSALYKETV